MLDVFIRFLSGWRSFDLDMSRVCYLYIALNLIYSLCMSMYVYACNTSFSKFMISFSMFW